MGRRSVTNPVVCEGIVEGSETTELNMVSDLQLLFKEPLQGDRNQAASSDVAIAFGELDGISENMIVGFTITGTDLIF